MIKKIKHLYHTLSGKKYIFEKYEKTFFELKNLKGSKNLSKSEKDVLNHIKSLSSGRGLINFNYLNKVERFLIISLLTISSFALTIGFYIYLFKLIDLFDLSKSYDTAFTLIFAFKIFFCPGILFQLFGNFYGKNKKQEKLLYEAKNINPLIKKAIDLSLKLPVNNAWAFTLVEMVKQISKENSIMINKNQYFSSKKDIRTYSGYVILPDKINNKIKENKFRDKI